MGKKLCPWSWVRPSAFGLGPYSRPRAQFFPIRTSRPVNNIYLLMIVTENNMAKSRARMCFRFAAECNLLKRLERLKVTWQVVDRAPTKSLHSLWSFASHKTCSRIRLRAQSSASAVRLQVELGLHLSLLPAGVHRRTTQEMLVNSLQHLRPIQRHFVLRMMVSQSSCAILVILKWTLSIHHCLVWARKKRKKKPKKRKLKCTMIRYNLWMSDSFHSL